MNDQERLIRINGYFNLYELFGSDVETDDLDGLDGRLIGQYRLIDFDGELTPLIEFNILQVADENPTPAELWLQNEGGAAFPKTDVSTTERPSEEWMREYAQSVEILSDHVDRGELYDRWRSIRSEFPEFQDGAKLRISDPTMEEESDDEDDNESGKRVNSAADW